VRSWSASSLCCTQLTRAQGLPRFYSERTHILHLLMCSLWSSGISVWGKYESVSRISRTAITNESQESFPGFQRQARSGSSKSRSILDLAAVGRHHGERGGQVLLQAEGVVRPRLCSTWGVDCQATVNHLPGRREHPQYLFTGGSVSGE